ncbi:solute carrier family 35 member F3 [Mustelus asterias]
MGIKGEERHGGTVGYGHSVPFTSGGKAFCMLYSLLGIPITLLLLTSLVQRLMFYVHWAPITYIHTQWGLSLSLVARLHAAVIGAIVIGCFFLLPALAFMTMENWDYLQSLYFCFISLSTIGLGDYVPGKSGRHPSLQHLYKIAIACYLAIGLVALLIVLETFYELRELQRFIALIMGHPDKEKLLHVREQEVAITASKLDAGGLDDGSDGGTCAEETSPGTAGQPPAEQRTIPASPRELKPPHPWKHSNKDQPLDTPTEVVPEAEVKVSEGCGAHCRSCCRWHPPVALGRLLTGLALACCLAASWAGMTQLAKVALREFESPFFMAWHSASWNLLLFPGYCSGRLLSLSERGTPPSRPFSGCGRCLSEGVSLVRRLLKQTAPFSILWTLTNYLYLMALRNISATDASALFCCNKAFVFLLSWIVLKDRFMGVRIVAAILSITGIVLIAYADGFRRDSIVGVAFVVGSASISALYKVLFKLLLGSVRCGEVALFLSALGAFNLLFLSWVSVILYVTRVEHWPSSRDVPWDLLCGLAALLLVFNILVNYGAAVTFPALVSLGVFLSVPVNAVTDIYRGIVPGLGDVRLAALLVLSLAFLLLLLPEDWDSTAVELLTKLRGEPAKEEPGGPESAEGGAPAGGRTRAAAVASSGPSQRRSETKDCTAA